MVQQLKSANHAEVIRYIINGLLATGIHYSVLTINMQLFNMQSAGIANMIAACFGITVSFVGNRYFVFNKRQKPIRKQAMTFALLYVCIACMHGLLLFLWSDVYKFDYRIGFIIATALQVLLSYLGNKKLVFKT